MSVHSIVAAAGHTFKPRTTSHAGRMARNLKIPHVDVRVLRRRDELLLHWMQLQRQHRTRVRRDLALESLSPGRRASLAQTGRPPCGAGADARRGAGRDEMQKTRILPVMVPAYTASPRHCTHKNASPAPCAALLDPLPPYPPSSLPALPLRPLSGRDQTFRAHLGDGYEIVSD